MFDWFKRKKHKTEKVKRDKDNRRIYKDEFAGEEIIIKSMTKGTEDRLIEEHKILGLNQMNNYYYAKVMAAEEDKSVSEAEVGKLEAYYFEAYARLEAAGFKCGKGICRDTVQKPKEWFEDLSREEWSLLMVTVRAKLDRIPIKQMYMEYSHDMIQYFRVNKGNSKFTGKEIAKIMEKRLDEYKNGSVKKNNWNTVLKDAVQRPVKTAHTHS